MQASELFCIVKSFYEVLIPDIWFLILKDKSFSNTPDVIKLYG